ncbi:polysaccharide pyruvyl transferase family protein [Rubellimicrobium arenae]|uniref:polysaccharide pyruvyl transferase family protein n=1 Tax=Rubellimicrobium arenae TaxID=2817372 RepID=UPI001B306314|nr:polysaccharide pyruvyl transferase family protein [Rubellimicrobium arenae]
MSKRPIRVCLLMHSTRSDNLGLGALTESEISILRDIARDLGREIQITILDGKENRVPYITGPDIRIVEMNGKFILNPTGFLREVRKADLVIDIGAGDSFADIYGANRLRRMFTTKFLTHGAGVPLVMAPQTVGPFTKPTSTRLAKLTMRLCALVCTRDAMSTDAIRDMGLKRPVIEASDVALRLPFDTPAPRDPGAPVRVGLNVSGLLMAKGYTGKNEFGLSADYPDLIRDIIRHFQGQGCEVHLVSHVHPPRQELTHREDDYEASTKLQAEFPGVHLAPRFRTPSEAKSFIAGLDFFMGARMHACIAAFSSGVPVVPMAYSRKFAGLFGSLGYDRTVDCTTETNDAILGKIQAAFDDRHQLAQETSAALSKGLKKLSLYQDALRDLIARRAGA